MAGNYVRRGMPMKQLARFRVVGALCAAIVLASCAGMEPLVSAPGVSLRNVHVTELDHKSQTFLLGFDITNPNPFPLPISHVAYGIELDGHQFAGGRAPSAFTVAAQSDSEFSISVELDLLRTAPKLLYVVHDGVTRDIPYSLKGELGVDIPAVPPLKFETEGEIRLFAAAF